MTVSYSSGFLVKSDGMIVISHPCTTFFTSSTKTVAGILNLELCMIFLATIRIKRKKEAVILIKGKYDNKRCIEALDGYMQSTGIVSDHTMDGATHCFTIQLALEIPGPCS